MNRDVLMDIQGIFSVCLTLCLLLLILGIGEEYKTRYCDSKNLTLSKIPISISHFNLSIN